MTSLNFFNLHCLFYIIEVKNGNHNEHTIKIVVNSSDEHQGPMRGSEGRDDFGNIK